MQRVDVRACEHYIPLQKYIQELHSNDTNKAYFGGDYDYGNYFYKNDSNQNNTYLSSNRKLLFWNSFKKFVTGAVGWVREAASKVYGFAIDSIDFVETLAGDVLEVIEEVGSTLSTAIVTFGEHLLEGIAAVIEFLEMLITGKIKIYKKYGIWIDNEIVTLNINGNSEGSHEMGHFEIYYKKNQKNKTIIKFGFYQIFYIFGIFLYIFLSFFFCKK